MDVASAATGHPLIAVDVYPGGDVAAIAARIREVLPDRRRHRRRGCGRGRPRRHRCADRPQPHGRPRLRRHEPLHRRRVLRRRSPRRAAAPRRGTRRSRRCSSAGGRISRPAVAPTRSSSSISPAGRSSSGCAPEHPNWRADNGDLDVLRKYKRGFFVEWRTADRHKRTLFDRIDLLVDGNAALGCRGRGARRGLPRGARRTRPRRPSGSCRSSTPASGAASG